MNGAWKIPARPSDEPPKPSSWLLSFTDLLLLVLAFFVMTFAMSHVKEDSWEALVRALAERLNPSQGWTERFDRTARNLPRTPVTEAADLGYLAAVIDEKLSGLGLPAGGAVRRLSDRLLVTFPEELAFAPRSAALTEAGRGAAMEIGAVLGLLANRVEVVGHTPPPDSDSDAGAVDWGLSLRRARALAAALQEAGYPHPVTSFGAGAARYYDVPPSLSEAERDRLARRVDLVIRTAATTGEMQ